jgi:dCTP deaminase
MILSDREVRAALERGAIRITPLPGLAAFSSTAVDLTLGAPSQTSTLPLGRFVLGWTAERIQLPHRARLAARVEGKSSMARLGLGIHVTAPTIHAGFGFKEDDSTYLGTSLQLEIWNVGCLHIVLDPGLPVCQLVLEEVHGTPEKGYAGRFASQGPDAPLPPPSTPEPKPRKRRR